MNKKIKSITKIKNAYLKNTHNDTIWDKQKLICIEYTDGTKNYVDLLAKVDITYFDYFEIIIKPNTKFKPLFIASEWNDIR